MSGEKRSIEYLASKVNSAVDDKQAVIYMVEADEKIHQKIKSIEKNAWKETLKSDVLKIDFNPKEIEPIIIKKDKNKEER